MSRKVNECKPLPGGGQATPPRSDNVRDRRAVVRHQGHARGCRFRPKHVAYVQKDRALVLDAAKSDLPTFIY